MIEHKGDRPLNHNFEAHFDNLMQSLTHCRESVRVYLSSAEEPADGILKWLFERILQFQADVLVLQTLLTAGNDFVAAPEPIYGPAFPSEAAPILSPIPSPIPGPVPVEIPVGVQATLAASEVLNARVFSMMQGEVSGDEGLGDDDEAAIAVLIQQAQDSLQRVLGHAFRMHAAYLRRSQRFGRGPGGKGGAA